MNPDHGLYLASILVLPAVIAITFHEAAHGFVAYRLGDDTAWQAGRVTFNPLRHIDPFGTVLLPALMYMSSGFLFGYAKPVPVNFWRLNNPRRDTVLVALAGPGTNVILAILSALLLHLVPEIPSRSAAVWVAYNLDASVQLNALLCVFNMLPVPPLDGGRVAVGILPRILAMPLARLERYGMLIVMLLFVASFAGRQHGFDPLGWLIYGPTEVLENWILKLAGDWQ